MSATTSPERSIRSTPRTAVTPGYSTTTRSARTTSPAVDARPAPRRGRSRGELGAQRIRETPRIAYGQRERIPPAQAAKGDDGRRQRIGREDLPGRSDEDVAVAAHRENAVGVVHHPFEAMLSGNNGDAEVMDEA